MRSVPIGECNPAPPNGETVAVTPMFPGETGCAVWYAGILYALVKETP